MNAKPSFWKEYGHNLKAVFKWFISNECLLALKVAISTTFVLGLLVFSCWAVGTGRYWLFTLSLFLWLLSLTAAVTAYNRSGFNQKRPGIYDYE